MGLLSLGTPLDWHSSKKYNEHVRQNAITQLINIFKQHANRNSDKFYWGDEVEYMMIDIDQDRKTAKLSIDKDYVLYDLNDPEKSQKKAVSNDISFHPEYGRFMIEATPLNPYDGTKLEDYLYVEENMKKRREICESELPSNVRLLTLTSYFRMGCRNFTSPPAEAIGRASQSLFLPDEIINRHVRFPTLTANIRKRKGCKVSINLPMYPDVNTKLLDDTIPLDRGLFASDKEPFLGAATPGFVYMDSMGFGMGSSCLQVTMQAANIHEARYLYDTLAPLAPLMLSLSAAAPIFKGYLVNQDVRWNVISGAVDDRTFIERNVEPYKGYDIFGGLDISNEVKRHFEALGGGIELDGDHIINQYGDTALKTVDGKPIQRIPKSRYDSIDNYLGDQSYPEKDEAYFNESYNDIYSPINGELYHRLLDSKLFDPLLARHFAHLFIRDPLVLFSERINQNNLLENDHFENIQSTNWQTLRFKPPALYDPATSQEELLKKPGWRVEFRPMEIQLTDFENAAYSVFIILISKAILAFKPDFYVPILKIEENMKTAHKVDSAINEKFWFKNFYKWRVQATELIGYNLSWFDRFLNEGNDELGVDEVYINGYTENNRDNLCYCEENSNECKYTLNEIFNGTEQYPGLLQLTIKYVATHLLPDTSKHHCSDAKLASKMLKLRSYLYLISQRAAGNIPTVAHWLRKKVFDSPLYKQDSKVSEQLAYELIKDCFSVTDLDFSQEELLSGFFGSHLSLFIRPPE